MLFELVYGVTAGGFRSKGIGEKWIGLAVSALVEDARLLVVIWLDEDNGHDPDELLSFLRDSSDAFASMICFERALSGEGESRGHVVEVLAGGFSPNPDWDQLRLPKPTEVSERRRSFELILSKYR